MIKKQLKSSGGVKRNYLYISSAFRRFLGLKNSRRCGQINKLLPPTKTSEGTLFCLFPHLL
jgi:hypothetical protein